MADSSNNSSIEPIDFSLGGAQSINLQNFLQSHETFHCLPCNRTFATHKGLQIHRSHHNKLSDKINSKKFERQRNESKEMSFYYDNSDQCHMPVTDLEEFLNIYNSELPNDCELKEKLPLNQETIVTNGSQSNLICSICQFVAKSRAGLRIHSKRHRSDVVPPTDIAENAAPNASIDVDNTLSRVRVSCPFSPSRTFVDKKRLQSHLDKKHCDELLNLDTLEKITPNALSEKLMFYRNNIPTLRRLPKGARFSAADKFSKLLNDCVDNNSVYAWHQLLTFSYVSFNLKGNDGKSLTTKVKENLKCFNVDVNTLSKKPAASLAKIIESKVNDFDIKGAIRILSSNDKLAPFTEETLLKLKSKNPTSSSIPKSEVQPSIESSFFIVNEHQVKKKINSFQYGSGPGIDGFRPQFFKDIISKTAGEAGKRALSAITRFSNFVNAGKITDAIKPIFFRASLCALTKKDNGIRPIAVGNALRRLCGKLACSHIDKDAHNYLNPHQVGVATKLGAESAIHAVRKYVHDSSNKGKVILKIDFQNAFNSIDRSKMLTSIAKHFPNLYQLISSSYSSPSLLFFGKTTISSEMGCHQGDPCGPLSFSATIHPTVEEIKSELNTWYLDDGTVGDYPSLVLKDFKMIIEEAENLGLKINPDKCELFFISGVVDETVARQFNEISPGIQITTENNLEILGVPIFEDGYQKAFDKKFNSLNLLVSRLEGVNSQTAYCLLKNCLFIPKLTYMLRTCAFWKYKTLTEQMDDFLKGSLESILNITIDDDQWIQAVLPISRGGLGIRRFSDICLPAFISSLHGACDLASLILPKMDDEVTLCYWRESHDFWNSINNSMPDCPSIQKSWDSINLDRIVSEIHLRSPKDVARFKALQQPESGGWLHVIPSNNIGTVLDDQDFQICVALRLGIKCFENYKCNDCGSLVDGSGTHGLSCPNAKGTYPRHVRMNHIIKRALTSARHSCDLEPNGLSRDDGKRPDGVTLAPWSKGKRLVWDVTCVDTLAPSYLNLSSKKAGAAAELACKRKHKHYTRIKASNFLFVGLAFETLGPWCDETKSFFDEIGKMLIKESGDMRAKKFLYERISLAIQQGNAQSILGTQPKNEKFNEIYNL